MDYMELYENWQNSEYVDKATKDELFSIRDNDAEIKERFYKPVLNWFSY